MSSDRNAYDELCCYTLERRDLTFIHQHVVDAFMAQQADDQSKPMGLAFALAGLYLHVVKGYSGRQVQHAHMKMARQKRSWPSFRLPSHRGGMTAADVMAAPPGPERDRAIDAWCRSVWEAYRTNESAVAALLQEYGID